MCLCNPRSGFVALGMASWSGRPVVLVGGSTGPAKEGLTMGWTMALSRLSPGIVVPSELATRARRKGRRGELSSVPEIPTTDLPCRSQHCHPIASQKPSSLFPGRDRFDFCRFQNRNQMGPPTPAAQPGGALTQSPTLVSRNSALCRTFPSASRRGGARPGERRSQQDLNPHP